MRTLFVAGIVATLLALPLGSADQGDIRSPSEVVLYRMADGHVLLAWNPTVGATHYVVYRGFAPGDLTQVYEGVSPEYFDSTSAPAGTTIYYVIAAIDASGHAHTTSVQSDSYGGDCVAVTSSLSFSVSIGNCLTIIPEL